MQHYLFKEGNGGLEKAKENTFSCCLLYVSTAFALQI